MITLSNDLSGIVGQSVNRNLQINDQMGQSLSTGRNINIDTIDCFVGNSLQDKGILLKSSMQSTSYGVNILNVADVSLNIISTLLQKSFNAICKIKTASSDQKAILQKIIDSNKRQIEHIIDSASFDNRKLLQGDISDIRLLSNNNESKSGTISIKNISKGRLFRTSFAKAINEWLAEDHTRYRYYQNQEEMESDIKNNNSLIHVSVWDVGTGTGPNISIPETCTAIIDAREMYPNIIPFIEATLPVALENIKAIAPANPRRDFLTATHVELFTSLSRRPGQPNPGMTREITPLIQDNADISLSTMETDVAYTLLHDIYTKALNTIRNEQASIANQKQNLLSLADSMRASSNVTEKAASSYLSTDYILAAESYAENIRKVVASITALQANNKIPDTIQKLLSMLAN